MPILSLAFIMEYMKFVHIDALEELNAKFEEEIRMVTNDITLRYKKISEKTLVIEKLYKDCIEKMCTEIDKGISANDEFRMHCEVLANELDGVENLSKQIHLMRKNCEEMEKKLMKFR